MRILSPPRSSKILFLLNKVKLSNTYALTVLYSLLGSAEQVSHPPSRDVGGAAACGQVGEGFAGLAGGLH